MISFQVNDMTCGHCAGAITQAVRAVDGDAAVTVDVAARRVAIDATRADAAALGAAIRGAGYTPVEVPQATGGPATTAARRGGCGCGCG